MAAGDYALAQTLAAQASADAARAIQYGPDLPESRRAQAAVAQAQSAPPLPVRSDAPPALLPTPITATLAAAGADRHAGDLPTPVPTDAETLLRLARAAPDIDTHLALDLIALRQDPTLAIVYSDLGQTLAGLGALDAAEAALRQGLALAPGMPEAHVSLAELALTRALLAANPAPPALAPGLAIQPPATTTPPTPPDLRAARDLLAPLYDTFAFDAESSAPVVRLDAALQAATGDLVGVARTFKTSAPDFYWTVDTVYSPPTLYALRLQTYQRAAARWPDTRPMLICLAISTWRKTSPRPR